MDGKQIGGIIVATIGILIGIALLTGAISGSVGVMRNTVTWTNDTYTLGAAGVAIDLTGQEFFSEIEVYNATNVSKIVPATNYTFGEGISSTTGYKTVTLTCNGGDYCSNDVNVSYTGGADGYVDSSGGRAIAGLIIVLVSMGIAFAALAPTFDNKDLLGYFRR